MSSSNAMRQLEERHVATKIELMVWSTKLDVLALSYANGEVALHRLNWLKVWVLPPPAEGLTVKGIAWRPDGKVIAVGYSNCEIVLVDVENKDILNRTKLDGEITCLAWTQGKEEPCGKGRGPPGRAPSRAKDECSLFLPKLPSLSRSFGPSPTLGLGSEDHVDDAKKMKDQAGLNLLLAGLGCGKLHLAVFGLFPTAVIDVQTYLACSECIILDANVSDNLKVILVVVSLKMEGTEKSAIAILLLNSEILSNNSRELHTLALKFGHVVGAMDYLHQTLLNITESWENILLEMDSKLTAYAAKVPPGRVSSDFLELLMFGTPSPEMSIFLLQELTERGLKKLGNSIELSYLNIQKLVLKHLHSVGQNLSYHVDELCGLSRCPSYSRGLGLDEERANAAFVATGAFLIKSTEVQQVIDDSLKKYKAFFRWLYVTILRLSDERVSAEVSKVSQQDLQYIADFLYNFEGSTSASGGPSAPGDQPSSNKPKFNLEKLGQYLLDRSLEVQSTYGDEYWAEFLEKKCPALKNHASIIPHHKDMSLVQEINHLEGQIKLVFKHSEDFIGKHFKLIGLQNFIEVYEPYIKLTNVYVSDEEKFLCAILDSKSPSNGFYLIDASVYPGSVPPKCLCLSVDTGEQEGANRIIDVQFYRPDMLSILMEAKAANRQAGFVQLPIRAVRDLDRDLGATCLNMDKLLESYVRTIDGIVASSFAVSGSRKVSVILSESKRKVRLYEMDVEDEEDEEDGLEAMEAMEASSSHSDSANRTADSGLEARPDG